MTANLRSNTSRALRVFLALVATAGAGAFAERVIGQEFKRGPTRSDFQRPEGFPVPAGNPVSAEKVVLGEKLFNEPRLSSTGKVACASCHNPALAFADGVARGKGVAATPLARHTPALWNLAWGETYFWDGRATSLEKQAQMPLENPLEMNMLLADATRILAADETIKSAFATAFPGEGLTGDNILKALAAYERMLVSPRTRFDRWAAGDDKALTAREIEGFEIFTGKAGCSSCHATWRFTDDAFHDIGLPDQGDKGRGAILKIAAVNNAFKTPSLRELAWTAPYMHDGSRATLDAVLDHYAGGVEARATLSKDLVVPLQVTAAERRSLLAFLATLSSDDPPKPENSRPVVQSSGDSGAVVTTTQISQKDKTFTPDNVRLSKGEALTIVNDDKRTHSVRVDDPRLKFSSDAEAPGDSVVLKFPEAGTYGVICSIHPKMKLTVTVTDGK